MQEQTKQQLRKYRTLLKQNAPSVFAQFKVRRIKQYQEEQEQLEIVNQE